jgi:YVTN family beta-propeller protein
MSRLTVRLAFPVAQIAALFSPTLLSLLFSSGASALPSMARQTIACRKLGWPVVGTSALASSAQRSIDRGMTASLTVLALVFTAYASLAGAAQAQSVPAPAATSTTETGFVYTADERGNSISVVDLSTGQVRTVPVRISPHNVQVSRDGRLLLAVGMLGGMKMSDEQSNTGKHDSEEMERGRMLIFDTATMNAERAIDIEIGRKSAHVIIDPQGRLAYASNGEDNTLSVVDVAQRKVIREIKTGKSPHGLRMSPDGREIYVANTGDNSVSVIDVARAKEVARIPVGKAPAQVGFTPDGRRVYVSSTVENSVVVVDTKQRKRIATIPVGREPIQLFATPDGRYVYVGNEGTKENPDNRASVIDTRTNSVVATVVTGKGAHGVVVSDDGRRAFIANTVDSSVSVIDTATQQVTRSIKVGEGAGGITFRSARQ